MHYAKELSKFIQVDIYGACGSLRCPRSQSQTCFDMLDEDYKFYLAFENSNCKDYITEKFFVNGLGYACFPSSPLLLFLRRLASRLLRLPVCLSNFRSNVLKVFGFLAILASRSSPLGARHDAIIPLSPC